MLWVAVIANSACLFVVGVVNVVLSIVGIWHDTNFVMIRLIANAAYMAAIGTILIGAVMVVERSVKRSVVNDA
jgi:hypothetical protein